MLTLCPTCSGTMSVPTEGDLHKSAGVIPCPNPECLGGYVKPPERDILVIQYVLRAILSLASQEEREQMARFMFLQLAAYPKREPGRMASKRLAAETQITKEHRSAIEAAIALILR